MSADAIEEAFAVAMAPLGPVAEAPRRGARSWTRAICRARTISATAATPSQRTLPWPAAKNPSSPSPSPYTPTAAATTKSQVVIPNGSLFGYLVMAGELALGVVLIGAAAVWLTRWSNLSTRGRSTILGLIVLAGVVAIFMNVNFHLMGGANHPWIIAADPNGEGVDLDSVMPIIQAIISVVSLYFLLALRRTSPAGLRSLSRPRPPDARESSKAAAARFSGGFFGLDQALTHAGTWA